MDGFQPPRVAMIGTGYVGLSTATALFYLGHHVVGVDKDEVKINLLRAGKSPIKEHGMEELWLYLETVSLLPKIRLRLCLMPI